MELKDEPHAVPGYDPSDKAREMVAKQLERFGYHRQAWYVRDTQGAEVPSVVAMALADLAIKRLEHAHQFYATRHARLRDFAKEKGFWPQVAAIIANGTLTTMGEDGKTDFSVYDPPTYDRILNGLRHRLEAAERRIAELEREKRDAEECAER